MGVNWLRDRRRQWAETAWFFGQRLDVKATPTGSRGYKITCFQLPGWTGWTDYSGPSNPAGYIARKAIEQGVCWLPHGDEWGREPHGEETSHDRPD